jgi:hypothetical protein
MATTTQLLWREVLEKPNGNWHRVEPYLGSVARRRRHYLGP